MKKITTLLMAAVAAMTLSASAQDNVQVAVFDFNALDPATTPITTGMDHQDGNIEEDLVLTEGDIVMTVTSNPNAVPEYYNQNRFTTNYAGLVQLQVFGGTITFEIEDGYIVQLTIYKQQWNYSNNIDGQQLVGENSTSAPRYWYGEQPTVVFNVGGNTQFNKIEVSYVKSTPTAITDINTNNVVSERYFDLQGRMVDATARGMVIRQATLADGKVVTTKVLR